MKILANKKIKALFDEILLCIVVFTLSSMAFLGFGVKNAALYIWLCALCMAAAIAAACYGYFKEQNKIMEAAVESIKEYISGNENARIESSDEGELYRLFHEVNSLASILNAHTSNEGKEKKFLQNAISDISHQLKTPLAALNIYNGIIKEEAEDFPEIREFVNSSEQELDRIDTLVQNLLNITKFDVGTLVLEKDLENVFEMMEDVKKRFLFRTRQEGKEILLTGDEAVAFWCDRNWLTEAVGNIVKNALDHTQSGGIIRIEWEQSASVMQIAVKDNGSGIHPEDLYHIFKRFYRSRYSKDTRGIGLGLPLAQAIIEAHGGMVKVESELGMGTAFFLNFLIPTKL